jgi:putative ABC transport system permease protein
MFSSYFKIAFRSLWNNKLYSALNIFGLGAGIAVALLIGLWVKDEIAYNYYNKDCDRIALLQKNRTFNGSINTETSNCVPLAARIRGNYGNYFEEVVVSSYGGERTLKVKETSVIKRGYFMEAGGQAILDLKIIKGSVAFPLDPGSILISASVAKSLFGDGDPLGQVINLDTKINLKVEGVYENLPNNSTFRSVNFYASFDAYAKMERWVEEAKTDWDDNSFPIYVKLAPQVSMDLASEKIKNLLLDRVKDGSNPELFLHAMSKWHLFPEFKNGKSIGSGLQTLWVFGLIGIFVLLLAAINFMNLSTARSEKRAKEIGIRKSVGSRRGQLITQFYVETYLVVFFAGILGLFTAQSALPWFNKIAEKQMVFSSTNPVFWLPLLTFLLLTGFVAGSYPALYLSSFRPVNVLKGKFVTGYKEVFSRKALVVFQFSISITLIIATLIICEQIQFAKNRPIGYESNGLIQMLKRSPSLAGHFSAIRQDLHNSRAIVEMAESNGPLTEFWHSSSGFQWKGKSASFSEEFITLRVTPEFGKTVNWKIAQGRDFSRDFATDSTAMILNESAVRLMGLQEPVNEMVQYDGKSYIVVGVSKDIVMESPYEPVKPTVFTMRHANMPFITIRLNPEWSAVQALATIETVLKKYAPEGGFNFKFLEEGFDKKFWREERIANLAILFSGMAIFISLLGIFGLASFLAEQRSKEIGIRKVLGASVLGITGLLTKDFLKLVVIAIFIASPLAWYFMKNWLADFTYRIDIQWWMFAIAGASALAIAFLTVGFQSVKAGLANPVKSLRSE